MIRVTDAQIVALLHQRPGLTANEIETHFNLGPAGAFVRLIKLAARGVIRAETASVSVRPGRHETTGAQVRRYFPLAALVAVE
jgi:hypothetical protein